MIQCERYAAAFNVWASKGTLGCSCSRFCILVSVVSSLTGSACRTICQHYKCGARTHINWSRKVSAITIVWWSEQYLNFESLAHILQISCSGQRGPTTSLRTARSQRLHCRPCDSATRPAIDTVMFCLSSFAQPSPWKQCVSFHEFQSTRLLLSTVA